MAPYRLIPREAWCGGSKPLVLQARRLPLPVEAVYFGYTRKDYGGKESPGASPDHEQTLRELKYVVKGDMSRNEDTRYNFLLGNDGNVYEGRGWTYRPYLPRKYSTPPFFNGIYITFIGDFRHNPPSTSLLEMRDQFIRDSVKANMIREKFVLVAMEAPWQPNLELYTYSSN